MDDIENIGVIGLAALGGALLGFVLQLFVAYYFGAGSDTDAFFMAQSTSELLSKLLLGGSIAAVFLPMFVEKISQGKRNDAWDMALNLFHIVTAVFVILLVLLALFAEPFVHFIAPGFQGETFDLTVKLVRVLLPSFLFLFLVELATAMFHAQRKFTLPALLRLVSPTVSVISIILLVKTLGIYALAMGVVIGSIIQLAILLVGLRREGLHYRFLLRPRDPAIRKLLYLVYPFIFSVLVTQGAGIVYRILVSDLESGSLSALKFADKISQLLIIIFLNSVTAVLFPLLSEKASRQDYSGMRHTLASAIRLIAFVTVPIVIGVALLRDPLIAVIYQRGSFSAEDASLTAVALLYLIIGLTANGVSSVLGHATLALQRTRAAVAVSIASQAVAIALFMLLTPMMAHAGLALTSSLVSVAIAMMYFFYLKRTIPDLGRIFWHPTLAKTLLLAGILGGVVAASIPLVSSLPMFWRLCIPTLLGASVYGLGAHVLRVPEMTQAISLFTKRFKRI